MLVSVSCAVMFLGSNQARGIVPMIFMGALAATFSLALAWPIADFALATIGIGIGILFNVGSL